MVFLLDQFIDYLANGGAISSVVIAAVFVWGFYTLDRRRQVAGYRWTICLLSEGVLTFDQLKKYNLINEMIEESPFLGLKP